MFTINGKGFTPLTFSLLLLSIPSCSKNDSTKQLSSPLAEAGRTTYFSNCIACHNPNPREAGSAGPSLENSSFELLYARLMKAEYPSGYKPKRSTKIMPAMPYLEEEIKGLEAFLKEP
ncbi:MAG: c-type cytochrome [Bacteriovoracaceae bacterium]